MNGRPVIWRWTFWARVLLVLCVWPLIVVGRQCAEQQRFPWPVWNLFPSGDGQLLWIKTLSQSRHEAFLVFDWTTRSLRPSERPEETFLAPNVWNIPSATSYHLPPVIIVPDAGGQWSLKSNGKRTTVIDDSTGDELFAIDDPRLTSRFVPATKELVYIGPGQQLDRVSLPSGRIVATHAFADDYRPAAIAWCIAGGCWLGGWILLVVMRGSLWWFDIPALSLSAIPLSAAYHLPLLDLDHLNLIIGLCASLAVLIGVGAASLKVSLPLTGSVIITSAASLALWFFLIANVKSSFELRVQFAIGMFAIALIACLGTMWRDAMGWHIARQDVRDSGRARYPSASLLHIFLLTASCAYLIAVFQIFSLASSAWPWKWTIEAINFPLLGALAGGMTISMGLGIQRWKWVATLAYLSAFWLVVVAICAATGSQQMGILGPRAPGSLGSDYVLWFATFIGLGVYLLRSSGLRMMRYAIPQPREPWLD